MRWHVEVQATGTPTDEQLEMLAGDGAIIVHRDTARRLVTITVKVEAVDNAIAAATLAIAAMPNLQRLVDDGALADPHRLLTETEEAHRRGASLIGAKETARRLNLSEARVRKLHEHPDWPSPVYTLPGGEQFHDPIAIDYFAGLERKAGRPPKAT